MRNKIGIGLICWLCVSGCTFETYDYTLPEPTILGIDEVEQDAFRVSWAEVFNADDYLLEVSQDSTFSGISPILSFKSEGTQENVRDSLIAPFERYYCRVSTTDEDVSDGNYSEVVAVDLLPLDVPAVEQDPNGPPLTYAVRIEMIRLAEEYEVEVATDADFANLVLDGGSVLTTQGRFEFEAQDYYTDYYVRVRAISGSHISEWSSVVFFAAEVGVSCTLNRIQNDSTAYTFVFGEPGTPTEGQLERMVLLNVNGGAPTPIQNFTFTYVDSLVVSATGNDVTRGSYTWTFSYDAERRLSHFECRRDTVGVVVSGDYVYSSNGLLASIDLVYPLRGNATDQVQFIYNAKGDVAQQEGPGGVTLNFTYENLVNPVGWLPTSVQLMVQDSPELAVLGQDYGWGGYLSWVPKTKAMVAVQQVGGGSVAYENFGTDAILRTAQSTYGNVSYSIAGCRQ